MRPAGLFVVSIRKTGGPNSALQRSDAGGSIWAGPLYTAKHLFCCMHFFIATVGPFKRLYMQCAMTMRKLPARASDGSFRRIRGDGWPSPRHNRGQPCFFAAAPVCKRSGRRRSCNHTRAKIPITQQKSVPNGHGLLLLVCGGDEGDRTPYLLNAIQALSQVSYTPTGLLPFGNRV